MNLKARINAELDRLAGSSVPEQGETICLDEPQGTVSCRVAAVDAIGCSFWELVYETGQLAQAGPQELKQLCERLGQQLNYLLEPIQLSELDDESCVAQMRSHPPSRDDSQTTYYELLARRGGQLRLSRFRKLAGQTREPIPAQVTREVLGRLAEDLSSI